MMIMLLLAVVRLGGAARGLEHGWLDSASKRQQAQAQALSPMARLVSLGRVALPEEWHDAPRARAVAWVKAHALQTS